MKRFFDALFLIIEESRFCNLSKFFFCKKKERFQSWSERGKISHMRRLLASCGNGSCCARERNGKIRDRLRSERDDHMENVHKIIEEISEDSKMYKSSLTDLQEKLTILVMFLTSNYMSTQAHALHKQNRELGGTSEDVNVVMSEIDESERL